MSNDTSPAFVEPYPGWADENKGPLILTVTGTLTGVTGLFVVGRIYSRLISQGRLAIDDYIIVICVFLSIAYVILASFAIKYGGGRHLLTLPPDYVPKAIYYTVVSFVPGVLSFTIPKLAVVILLAKILDPSRLHKIIMWIISILYVMLSIGMLVINFVQCNPPSAQWNGPIEKCWNRKITVDYAMTLGICSVLFDLYLAVYPTIVLSKLQLNWKKKLGLSAALGFGYCAAAITSYKCYTLDGLSSLVDFTYAVDDVVLWTNIEGNCVLIGACIPTLFPLIKKIFGASALGSTPRRSDRKQTGGQNNSTIVTIGSYPKGKKRTKSGTLGMTALDTVDEDAGKYIILEERSFHTSTTELRAEEAAQLQEQLRATKQPGW